MEVAPAPPTYKGLERYGGEFTLISSGGATESTVSWLWAPSIPTKNQNGITGWATSAGERIRVHVCAHRPCNAVHPPSKYGHLPVPMHGYFKPAVSGPSLAVAGALDAEAVPMSSSTSCGSSAPVKTDGGSADASVASPAAALGASPAQTDVPCAALGASPAPAAAGSEAQAEPSAFVDPPVSSPPGPAPEPEAEVDVVAPATAPPGDCAGALGGGATSVDRRWMQSPRPLQHRLPLWRHLQHQSRCPVCLTLHRLAARPSHV